MPTVQDLLQNLFNPPQVPPGATLPVPPPVLPQAQQLPPLPPPKETPVNLPWSPGAYGTEAPRKSYQDILNELVKNITEYQKAHPVKVPFPAGTKTLAKQQLEEQKRQFEKEYALRQKELALAAARARASSGGARQPTLTERRWAAEAAAYNAVNEAVAKGLSAEEIKASIDSQIGDLVGAGVDVGKLKQYVDAQAEAGRIRKYAGEQAQPSEPTLWEKVKAWFSRIF